MARSRAETRTKGPVTLFRITGPSDSELINLTYCDELIAHLPFLSFTQLCWIR